MQKATLYLPHLWPYQRNLVADQARDACCVSAAQVGKSFALAAWLLGAAWTDPVRSHPWWWTAPTYGQAVVGFRLVLRLSQSAGIIRGRPITAAPQRIALVNGGMIEFRSWEREQNLHGTTIAGGVVDEAGLLTPEAQAAISARRSATLGPLRYIGNPGLVAGPFRKLCSLAERATEEGSDLAGVYSLHKWTWKDKYLALAETNLDAARAYETFINQERLSLPEFEFRRLYEAEWTEDEAAVFRGVHEATSGEMASEPDGEYQGGVDVAQSQDYLVVALVSKKRNRAEYMERWRGVSYPQSAIRMKEMQGKWGAPFVVEENGPGIALIQELDRLGVRYVPFTTSSQSKQEIILSLAADIQNQRLSLAPMPPLQYELAMYRYSRTPSGLYSYSAPPGEHDDTVMALALARWGMAHQPHTGLFDFMRATSKKEETEEAHA